MTTRMGTLTSKQRAFVNAYVSNGQNGTQAAREAGYKGNDNVLGVTAHDLLKVPKVQEAIQGLLGKAIAKAERGAIGDLAETLEYLFTVQRANVGDYMAEAGEVLDPAKVKTAPAGLFRMTPKGLEQMSPLGAAQALQRHFDALKAPEMFRTALTDALRDVADEGVVRLLARRLLTGSVNGNGHVVDVQAQVVK